MSSRSRRFLLAAAAVAGGALAVPAGGSTPAIGSIGPASAAPVPSSSDAVSLLEQAYSRSRTETYHGVQLVMVDQVTRHVGVSHAQGHTFLYAVGAGADGQVYEAADQTPATSAADPLSKDPLALLEQHYRLAVLGSDRVMGRPAVVVAATASDGTVAAKFWIDDASSLVVRRDTFDSQQNAYTRVCYESLTVNAPAPAMDAKQLWTLQPAGTEQTPARLRAQGWWAQTTLPGGLTLFDARELGTGSTAVLHLAYSDGLSTVSVFEQRGRLASGAVPAGWSRVIMPSGRHVVQATGQPLRVAWQAHDLVVAVVADLPQSAATALVEALPYGAAPAQHGMVVGRLSRGLHRIGSLLTP